MMKSMLVAAGLFGGPVLTAGSAEKTRVRSGISCERRHTAPPMKSIAVEREQRRIRHCRSPSPDLGRVVNWGIPQGGGF